VLRVGINVYKRWNMLVCSLIHSIALPTCHILLRPEILWW
jgi:hypothetical protein